MRKENIPIDIVFITVTQDYAIAGYDVAPILYLVKPVEDTQLQYALDIFLKRHMPSHVLLNLSGEILSLKILFHQLPSSVFARSHQSYLINMEHIDSIARYKLTLSTGQALPISQSRYLELQNSFLLYAGRQKIWI